MIYRWSENEPDLWSGGPEEDWIDYRDWAAEYKVWAAIMAAWNENASGQDAPAT